MELLQRFNWSVHCVELTIGEFLEVSNAVKHIDSGPFWEFMCIIASSL